MFGRRYFFIMYATRILSMTATVAAAGAVGKTSEPLSVYGDRKPPVLERTPSLRLGALGPTGAEQARPAVPLETAAALPLARLRAARGSSVPAAGSSGRAGGWNLSGGASAAYVDGSRTQMQLSDMLGYPPAEIVLLASNQTVLKYAVRSKTTLAIIELIGLGVCGIDRCYMGQACTGFLKFLTAAIPIWAFLDYVGIMVNILLRFHDIDYLGYQASFEQEDVVQAFWVTLVILLFQCFSGHCGTTRIPDQILYQPVPGIDARDSSIEQGNAGGWPAGDGRQTTHGQQVYQRVPAPDHSVSQDVAPVREQVQMGASLPGAPHGRQQPRPSAQSWDAADRVELAPQQQQQEQKQLQEQQQERTQEQPQQQEKQERPHVEDASQEVDEQQEELLISQRPQKDELNTLKPRLFAPPRMIFLPSVGTWFAYAPRWNMAKLGRDLLSESSMQPGALRNQAAWGSPPFSTPPVFAHRPSVGTWLVFLTASDLQ